MEDNIYTYIARGLKLSMGYIPNYIAFERIDKDVFIITTHTNMKNFIILDTSKYFKWFSDVFDLDGIKITRTEELVNNHIVNMMLDEPTKLVVYKDGVRSNTNEVGND